MNDRTSYLKAFSADSVDDFPVANIHYSDSDFCKEFCRIWAGRMPASFLEYFCYEPAGQGWSQRYVPMLIDLDEYPAFSDFEHYIKQFSDGERMRMARRSAAKGYTVKQFHWNLFIPDIHAINTSTNIRSGGEMRGGYLRTVEELGGAPKTNLLPPNAPCRDYWQHCFGVFAPQPGYKQGEVETGERLLAYYSLRRLGNFVMYSMLLGHHAHLREGIMDFGHQAIMQWLIESKAPESEGIKYVLYGGMENGTEGLFQWKRRSGFKPYRVYCQPMACTISP